MKKKKVSVIFWSLVGVFVLIASIFFIPAVREFFKGPQFLLPFIVFSFLGGVLIFFTIKEKIKGMMKKFLILTGASAAGFFVSIFLHNFIYGSFIVLFGSDFWTRIGMVDEPFFFFLAILVFPLGFIVGVVGSVVLFLKEKR